MLVLGSIYINVVGQVSVILYVKQSITSHMPMWRIQIEQF